MKSKQGKDKLTLQDDDYLGLEGGREMGETTM